MNVFIVYTKNDISSMPYLESEQQDETRNVTEYDSEKAAVTDAQETTANEQTKPRTKRLRLDSKIKGNTKDPMLFCFSNHSSSFSLCTNVV
jgi:hypothetical protein